MLVCQREHKQWGSVNRAGTRLFWNDQILECICIQKEQVEILLDQEIKNPYIQGVEAKEIGWIWTVYLKYPQSQIPQSQENLSKIPIKIQVNMLAAKIISETTY